MYDDTRGSFVYLLGWSLAQIGIILETFEFGAEYYCVVAWYNKYDDPASIEELDVTIVRMNELLPAHVAIDAARGGKKFSSSEQFTMFVKQLRTVFGFRSSDLN